MPTVQPVGILFCVRGLICYLRREAFSGEMSGVGFCELLLVIRKIFLRIDRVRRASWNASAAVNASGRINKHLRGDLEFGLVFLRMNAVGRADIDAKRVLDAVVGDDVGHEEQLQMK